MCGDIITIIAAAMRFIYCFLAVYVLKSTPEVRSPRTLLVRGTLSRSRVLPVAIRIAFYIIFLTHCPHHRVARLFLDKN